MDLAKHAKGLINVEITLSNNSIMVLENVKTCDGREACLCQYPNYYVLIQFDMYSNIT